MLSSLISQNEPHGTGTRSGALTLLARFIGGFQTMPDSGYSVTNSTRPTRW